MADLSDVYEELVASGEAEGDSEAPEVDNPEPGITDEESQITTEDEVTEDTPDLDTDLEPEAETSANVLEWESIQDSLIPVKVNGEEKLVSLKEYRDGIMMREDYSRKTAELAQDRPLIDWAKDIQYALANDPLGTINAIAEAYKVPLGQPPQAAEVAQEDPYEDWDPEMAQLARAMDTKLAQVAEHYEQKIARLESQTGQITHERMVQEAQQEMRNLETQFTQAGFEFNAREVLGIATTNEIDLTQAAYIWAGSQAVKGGMSKSEAAAKAAEAANAAAQVNESQRQANKKRASSAATKKYDASDSSVENFDTLTDLFNIELARQS